MEQMQVTGGCRYHCESNPPPDLRAVCKRLEKAFQRRPIRGQNEVRAVAKRASREYDKVGPADDVARFLLKERVLLLADGKDEMYYDAERAQVVMQACEEGKRAPVPALKDAERIAALRDTWAPDSSPSSSPDEPLADDTVEQPTETDVTEAVVEEAPTPVAETAIGHSTTTTELSKERFVLYLTPVEYDVWENFLIVCAEENGEFRVPVPKDDVQLQVWCRKGRAVAEYRRALDRFIQSGIISLVGGSGGGKDAYRLASPPETYHVEKIWRRYALFITAGIVTLVQQHLESAIRGGGVYSKEDVLRLLDDPAPFEEEASKPKFRRANTQHLEWLYLGKEASQDSGPLMGFFHRAQGTDRYLAAYPGFGPYRLVRYERKPRLVARIYELPCPGARSDFLFCEATEEDASAFNLSVQLFADDAEYQDSFSTRELLETLSDQDLRSRAELLHWAFEEIPSAEGRISSVIVGRQQAREEERRRSETRQRLAIALEQSRAAENEARLKREALEAELAAIEKE